MREKTTITQSDATHHRSSSDSLAMLNHDELSFGAALGFDSYWDPGKMTDLQEMRSVDFLEQSEETGREEHELQNMNEMLQPSITKQDSVLGILTPSRSSTPPCFDTSTTSGESLDFDAALKLCGDLDRSCRALREGQLSVDEVEGVIRMVEYTCATARMSALSALAEKASTALILAALYKVFDVCETMARQINDSSALRALECLFRLKRLDLAILQAYMFLDVFDPPAAAISDAMVNEVHLAGMGRRRR